MRRAFPKAFLPALLVCAFLPGSSQLSAAPQVAAAQGARTEPLAWSPEELPRAPAGRWDGFFDPAGFEERLRALDPGWLSALGQGEAAYRRGDFPRALEVLFGVLEESPDLPPAWLILGTTYFRLQRYSDGRTAFERFLAVAPDQAWRTQGLGHCYYSLGEYEAARAHYELVLEGAPKSPEARRGLALAHWRLGQTARALELLETLSHDQPQSFEAQLWYGRVLFDAGDSRAALELARRATGLAGHDPRGWFLLLECLWDLGQEDEAQRVEYVWRERDRIAQERRRIEAELRTHPADWQRLRRAVDLALSVADGQAVKTFLPRLLKARPDDVQESSVRLFALEAMERLGEVEAARAVARGIERACADEVEAWRALEAFYGRTGDREGQVRAGERRRRLGGGG